MNDGQKWQERLCTSWGRISTARIPVLQPETCRDLSDALSDAGSASLLAFGGGRSYGDNAINSGGRAVATQTLNRIISFDERTGELICEAGITYRELVAKFLPRGLVVPVSPGTGFATLGGSIANDVHGKNHDRHGSLGDHLNWIELICADGSVMRASNEENRDVFDATIGGIGLTGIITRVSLNLDRIGGDSVIVKEQRISDLEDFMDKLMAARSNATYSVGWIDVLKKGAKQGRGILETAELAGEFLGQRPRRGIRMPIDLPSGTLNRHTVSLFNSLYYGRIPAGGRERMLTYDRFTYPLDSILDWNRIYGSRGFYQFQCVLPDEESPRGLRIMLDVISNAGAGSFLAVLKTLGSSGRGYLSFPKRGYTLALDLPHRSGSVEILQKLEKVTLDHGGRVYLAKDSVLSKPGFREMYPRHVDFSRTIDRLDPERRFRSDMAVRLGLRPEH